eukprot:jgi/Psemu1/20704/gm1.20704_g
MADPPPQPPPLPSLSSSSSSSSSTFSSSPFRSQLYAQEMNNSAASCIEVGLYSRAATSLTRALTLSRKKPPPRESICTCHHCTLDGCITRSRVVGRVSAPLGDDDDDNNHNNHNSDSDEERHPQERQPINDGDNNNNNNNNNNDDDDDDDDQPSQNPTEAIAFSGGSYVTRRPIRVECQGHVMGPALYLIITFNLALTNHLMGLSTQTVADRANRADKALELYQLTYDMQANILHHESEKDPPLASPTFSASIRSIRFEMMILNNIGQIHKKLTRNSIEHNKSFRRLLSTMMIVVDHHVRITTAEGAVPIDPIWQIDMDGFLKNTVYLILGNIYTSGSA